MNLQLRWGGSLYVVPCYRYTSILFGGGAYIPTDSYQYILFDANDMMRRIPTDFFAVLRFPKKKAKKVN